MTDPIACDRCQVPLEYAGTRDFHHGTRWGALGDLGELFVDGVGEELRPQQSE